VSRPIGADRLVLIGHSWGGQVAAAYLAAPPGYVAKVVFSSPGALAPAVDDGSGGRVRARLTRGQPLGLYPRGGPPPGARRPRGRARRPPPPARPLEERRARPARPPLGAADLDPAAARPAGCPRL